MLESELEWPLPSYNPGPSLHLHALGVIAVTFASFERSLDFLFIDCARHQNMPDELTNIYYFNLDQQKRLSAIKEIFSIYEKDIAIKGLIDNIVSYFNWSHESRNLILHSEMYPPGIGGKSDMLYLIKPFNKKSPKPGYMKFELKKLRDIADSMRKGVVQCAEIHIYLRYRGRPIDSVPNELKSYVGTPPQALIIPKRLTLSEMP